MDRAALIAEMEEDARHVIAPLGQEQREEAAGCRALMGFWLRALARVATMLADRIVGAQPQAPDAAPPSEAHGTARRLLQRAERWMQALHRLLGTADAVTSRRLDRMSAVEALEGGARPAAKARPNDGPGPGRSAAELIHQICADLGSAAWLLGEQAAAREVTYIGISAQAMLTGGATEELREWADAQAGSQAEAEAPPQHNARPLAIAPPDAPDTG